ncbi:MAG: hypothetical protein V4663_15375 [Bacteroidota bacterium]
MKRFSYRLVISLVLLASVSKAQTNTFPTTGNAGIGILSPTAGLEIYRTFNVPQTKSLRLFFQGTWGFADYATNYRFLDIASSEGGKILQVNGYGIGIGYDPPIFESADRLYVSGNVGIGTTTPTEKLAVNGNIRAREVKVESAPWPDYVFAKGYALPSLAAIEKSIQKNGHLPGMPSAKAVAANGIKLGEMNAKLLEKIEELTLHLIAQQKRITALEQQQKKQR